MRIVIFVLSFPKNSETFVVNHFLGLLEKGWDIHVICYESDKEEWAYYPKLKKIKNIKDRIHIIPLSKHKIFRPFRGIQLLIHSFIKRPFLTLRYFKFGLFHYGFEIFKKFFTDFYFLMLKPSLIHFEFGTLAVQQTHLAYILQCKTVVSFRGYDLNFVGIERHDYYEKVWKRIDGFHFLGQHLKILAERRGFSGLKKSILIPPAMTLSKENFTRETAQNIGIASRPVRLISVGRLRWEKGYEYALQAVSQLLKRNIAVEYRILGSGEYLEALSFCRYQLQLENHVQFLQSKSHEEVLEALKWADIFVHAAVSEGFGNAVIEAQYMQLPVVATDAGGLSENVLDGVTGFIVKRRDPGALAEKIAALIQDPAQRQAMGEKGRQRVLQHFKVEDQIKKFDHFYDEILNAS